MEVPLLRRRIEVDLCEEILSSSARQFGFSRLTDDQRETISAFLLGKDFLVSLPTRSGESLCFALVPKVVELLKITLDIKEIVT